MDYSIVNHTNDSERANMDPDLMQRNQSGGSNEIIN
jgi:hypothetical protein